MAVFDYQLDIKPRFPKGRGHNGQTHTTAMELPHKPQLHGLPERNVMSVT